MFDDFLCVIPARSGSKGIKDKNMQFIGKYALFEYSVFHAIDAGIPRSNIIVSSDSNEILKLAKCHGVVCHRRPGAICGDLASTESALLDALKIRPESKHILLLQPTSPIRFRGRVKNCIIKYLSGDYDSLVTATKLDNLFWHEAECDDRWSWVCTTECLDRPRRQDMQTLRNHRYFENGNIYITDVNILKKRHNRIGYNVCVYQITEIEGMQIDNYRELEIFRHLFEAKSFHNFDAI